MMDEYATTRRHRWSGRILNHPISRPSTSACATSSKRADRGFPIDFEDARQPSRRRRRQPRLAVAREGLRECRRNPPPFIGMRIKPLNGSCGAEQLGRRSRDDIARRIGRNSDGDTHDSEDHHHRASRVHRRRSSTARAVTRLGDGTSGRGVVETPRSFSILRTVIASPNLDASDGRCRGAHSDVRLHGELQHHRRVPAHAASCCEFAKHFMQVAFAGTMYGSPTDRQRSARADLSQENGGPSLSADERFENSASGHCMAMHFDDCAFSRGRFYQGWDFIPRSS